MTQINITINLEDLKDKVEKSSLESPVKASLALILNSLMEKERDEYINALSHERTDERKGYRNGYYERELITGVGSLKLKVPRSRDGEFSTTIFEKYKRCDQALILSMVEMVVNGVSTRKVTKIVEELCGTSVSKSLVSNLIKSLDPIINDWKNRPLNTYYYPYIYVDAMYIKVRENRKVVSKSVHIAVGVNETGHREIIGLKINHTESTESWTSFFDYLKSRGLQSPKMVISDAHGGLVTSIKESFLGTAWQRCCVHFLKNIVDTLPKKGTSEARQELKDLFRNSDLEVVRELKTRFTNKYEGTKGFSKAIDILDDGFEDAIQFLSHPVGYHKHLRTTNMLERVNQEVRRREKVIRIFTNEQSAIRIIGSVLMDIEEDWNKNKTPYLKN
ncbi:IS256 family transposase [Heyndrickxia sporothermodurans]|uniref:Mutator family transposase n=3 Tax=Heyndrickxia sporothermodurans TaxID=46224 RepID=A0AB37HFW8_9BACI|nr:IS256 family transposase [Heyndrickxia sporothermodurans]MBL5769369.1 IS256 family transposase [Heyndrickxia sporothermodurans]MBL5773147.1 IS256 family transposase [Heyndrickxia sporothermodurans]MBL5776637.1 IS256 family transposase [Heyndrickxia sporothermodurans]MBL5780151.1 IS256 family transposase [Heyndrickxia sporothermodurans]MBL5783736.1 IS256 family transposase [Heyndrickxia sporothermodurans]